MKQDGFGHEKPGEGATNDWLTPPRLVEMLGHFDLDPCACPSLPWKLADENYCLPEQDGLILDWSGRVFCNPPYGPHVDAWVERMAAHRNGILLIFNRSETAAWKRVWATGDAFLFPEGRTCFYLPDGRRARSGTAPSALIAYGEWNALKLQTCGLAGTFFGKALICKGIKISTL